MHFTNVMSHQSPSIMEVSIRGHNFIVKGTQMNYVFLFFKVEYILVKRFSHHLKRQRNSMNIYRMKLNEYK